MGSPLASPTPTSLCYTLHIFVCILYTITIPYYTTHYKYTVCRCGTGIYLQKSIKGNTIQPSQRHSNKVANGIVAAQRFARHMCIVCTPYSEHNMMGGGKIICPRYREEKKTNSIDAAQLRKINVSGGCIGITCYGQCVVATARSYYARILQPIYIRKTTRNQISRSAPFNRMLWRCFCVWVYHSATIKRD